MEFYELRYPFNNIFEYVRDYALNVEGIHLAIGFFIVFYIIYSVCKSKLLGEEKLGTLVVFLWPFTNPAYIYIISLAEFFLVLNALYIIIFGARFNKNIIFTQFVLLCFSILLHFIMVNLYLLLSTGKFIILQGDAVGISLAGDNFFNRFIVIFKVLLIPFLFLSFSKVKSIATLSEISRIGSKVAALISVVYIIQFVVLLSGRVPYGTFDSAGFGGFPSFAAVSVERGHLSKFMAPFLPFLLIDMYLNRRYMPIILYTSMMLLNFSASGYIFFACAIFATIFLCRRVIFTRENAKYTLPAVFLSLVITSIYLWFFSSTLNYLLDKVFDFVFSGDETGGRTISLLMQYLDLYPYGFGYGGSTFRTIYGLPEINMGIYSMFTQIGIIAFFFYVYLIGCAIVVSKRSKTVVEKILCGGVILMPIVFSADILWFVPTYWAPLILISWFQINRER
ncbi:Uncharacterised protein [Yersinia nurmii]|uniref:O-antigen polymerase n=1 Tax=Yersinia nurmii TaxID=685706 RepID=A0ABM9SIH9_9GAMM|nr:hypothetical protein [Yersinia nurmii]CNE67153.1 Uncharacterised protein [Yersinia nurmii]